MVEIFFMVRLVAQWMHKRVQVGFMLPKTAKFSFPCCLVMSATSHHSPFFFFFFFFFFLLLLLLLLFWFAKVSKWVVSGEDRQ